MLEQAYIYEGPVYKFNNFIKFVSIGTTAISKAKAINNIRWKLAREANSRFCIFNIDTSRIKLKGENYVTN